MTRLRSLPAKQHAPKARPSFTRHPPWPARRGPEQAVKGEWVRRGCRAVAGCRTFALDGRASRPISTTSLPASLMASMPGGGASPRTPLLRGQPRTARYEAAMCCQVGNPRRCNTVYPSGQEFGEGGRKPWGAPGGYAGSEHSSC
jgi:hypothetical protein